MPQKQTQFSVEILVSGSKTPSGQSGLTKKSQQFIKQTLVSECGTLASMAAAVQKSGCAKVQCGSKTWGKNPGAGFNSTSSFVVDTLHTVLSKFVFHGKHSTNLKPWHNKP